MLILVLNKRSRRILYITSVKFQFRASEAPSKLKKIVSFIIFMVDFKVYERKTFVNFFLITLM